MTQYRIDERDLQFNMFECPGVHQLDGVHPMADGSDDTLRMVYEQCASFCQKVLAPLHDSGDREGCSLVDGQVQVPNGMQEAWDQYRELGLIGMMAEAAWGGSELPHFFAAPVAELECGSCVSFSMLPLLTRGAANLIASFGSDALKQTFLEKMYSGEWSGTMCLTEPHAGSDVGASTTKAVPDGDHYLITGTKIFITWGEHPLSQNIIHLVLARTPDAPRGSRGLSLFAVPKHRSDANGNITEPNDVSCGSIEHKMGIKASPTCVMNFGTNNQCRGYLVGKLNQGIAHMFQMMNSARIEVGVQGLAQGAAAYLAAREYARERTQGSIKDESGVRSAKIVEHPDVQRMLANMKALVEGGRALLYHLTLYIDLADHHPTQSERYQGYVDLLTPICKTYGSDQGFRVTELAIQTLGGYGYCNEYSVEQYMRDVKITSIYEGTNGIQALDLVFRKIIGSKGALLEAWLDEVQEFCTSLDQTELDPIGQAIQKVSSELAQTAQHLAANMGQAQYYAVAFQEAMSLLAAAYYLARQAQVASAKAANSNDAFYAEKIVTAMMFSQEILPKAGFSLAQMRQVVPIGMDLSFR